MLSNLQLLNTLVEVWDADRKLAEAQAGAAEAATRIPTFAPTQAQVDVLNRDVLRSFFAAARAEETRGSAGE